MNASQHDEIVFTAATQQACAEQALVLRAVGIDSTIRREPGEYRLLVALDLAPEARKELDTYRLENPAKAFATESVSPKAGGWGGVTAYALVILVVAICQDRAVFGADWFAAGRANAGLIRDGQLWRVFTALTLHVDRAHLIANLLVGGVFGLFVAQLLGSGAAWLSIVLAGGVGNLINACFRPESHSSVGASTAVFAALGICAAFAWIQRRKLHEQAISRLAPLIGGVILLGYLGTGGARTDVGGHVAGFVCGLFIGAVLGTRRPTWCASLPAQFALSAAALAVVVGAWAWGLSAAPH